VDRAGFQLEAAVAQGDNAAEGLLEPSTLSSAAALPACAPIATPLD
jgi:hypothetical protein